MTILGPRYKCVAMIWEVFGQGSHASQKHENLIIFLYADICHFCSEFAPFFFSIFWTIQSLAEIFSFLMTLFYASKSSKSTVFYETYGPTLRFDVSKLFPKRFQNQSKTFRRWFGFSEMFPNRFGIDLESVPEQFQNAWCIWTSWKPHLMLFFKRLKSLGSNTIIGLRIFSMTSFWMIMIDNDWTLVLMNRIQK